LRGILDRTVDGTPSDLVLGLRGMQTQNEIAHG
jgi:hypothetical protein